MDRTPEEIPVAAKTADRVPVKKFREKFWIFIGCLILSGMMWLFIELTRDYTADVKYRLKYTNIPGNLLIVNEQDSIVTIGIKAQGFDLLEELYLKRNKTLEIDLSNLKITSDNHGFSAFLPANRLLNQISGQMKGNNTAVSVTPDTLFFRLSEVTKTRVPVIPVLNLGFKPQYGLLDSVKIEPGFISVSSIRSITDTLKNVFTLPLDMQGIDSSFSVNIPLNRPVRSSLIRFSQDSVKVMVQVARFTEKELEIPLGVKGISNAKTFPDKVIIKCLIPVQIYRDIVPSMFEAEIDPSIASTGSNKAKVIISRMPLRCRLISVEPAEAEFLIIGK